MLLMIMFIRGLLLLFFSQTPFSLTIRIISRVFILSFWLFVILKDSLFPCIVILVILGGLIILFLYLSVLVERYILVSYVKILRFRLFSCSLVISFTHVTISAPIGLLYRSSFVFLLLLFILPFLFLIVEIIRNPFNRFQYFFYDSKFYKVSFGRGKPVTPNCILFMSF